MSKIGWINDSKELVEAMAIRLDLAIDDDHVLEHTFYYSTIQFLAKPKRCDLMLLDLGELGSHHHGYNSILLRMLSLDVWVRSRKNR
jgi:hypothetical protein